MYQFRERTSLHPEPLIIVSPEVATVLSNKQASPELYERIRPGGRVHLDLRGLGLVEHLPQKTAWNHALSQIGGLLAKRSLDESITPSTLQEPAMHCEGVPVTGVFQQTLGFQTPEAIQAIPIEEVITRTQALIEQYLAQFADLIKQHGLDTTAESAWSRWYVIYIRKLRRLEYFLHCLQHHQDYLQLPTWRPADIFGYLRTWDLIPTVEMIRQLLPSILQSYVALVQKNVSVFAEELALFRHSDTSLIVEVTRDTNSQAMIE